MRTRTLLAVGVLALLPAVARAWGQPAWADYSGVSRTLAHLTQAETEQILKVLAKGKPTFY